MTCIAAYIEGETGRITMGGDSASVSEHGEVATLSQYNGKVVKRSLYIIGSCGLGAGIDFMRYAELPQPKVGEDVSKFMHWDFLRYLQGYLPERVEKTNEFLVGIQGRLFRYFGGRAVEEAIEPYNAIGSGRQVALGVFYAMDSMPKSTSAWHKVYQAISAAEHFTEGVRGPAFLLNDGPEVS